MLFTDCTLLYVSNYLVILTNARGGTDRGWKLRDGKGLTLRRRFKTAAEKCAMASQGEG
jgi:hypothetical protein